MIDVKNKEEMKETSFKGGEFVCPGDWIEGELDNPEEAEIAYVMEVLHEDCPHIYFFSNKSWDEFSEDDEKRLKDAMCAAWDGMRDIYEREIRVVSAGLDDGVYVDVNGNHRTLDEWEKAPVVGYFNINPSRWNEKTPGPYGAYVKVK